MKVTKKSKPYPALSQVFLVCVFLYSYEVVEENSLKEI